MKKIISILSIMFVFTLTVANIASAHVTVSPDKVAKDSYQVFTLRVPTEEDVPTIKVKVTIPKGVDISRFEPKAGWSYKIEKDNTGKIISVTWTAENNGLTSTEFGEFKMQGKVSADADKLVWKAYQTYKGGKVVKWIQAEDGDHPASVTKVGASAADSHNSSDPQTDSTKTGDSNSSQWPLYLSIAAVILSIIALITGLSKRK
ncbi:uncharacterized protein YcnI [Scopulibacillus darangshiensis]|uniref:Uncharacterized protein YcnI n=1 Tax=Scopulibacillus darangshiensis TaxID=442528 RepID=A0A4R2NF66_9BACL|nr:YcnI family protein [Scopulibacillus darangshiensis]TCP19755.1 uncharacterized protein YcnI [Scopulibacillus darangshiensis]